MWAQLRPHFYIKYIFPIRNRLITPITFIKVIFCIRFLVYPCFLLGEVCGGIFGGYLSLCVKESGCWFGFAPSCFGVPPFWWVAFLCVAVLPCGPALLLPCGFWSSLCPLLLLFPLCPSSVLPLLSPLLLRLGLRCWLLCLVLGGLLPCRLWRFRCLVWTRSPWSALTGVSVSVVLPLRLVRWVVRSRWTSCSPVCRLVLGRLFGSVLRSGTRLTRGLLVLSLSRFLLRTVLSVCTTMASAIACLVLVSGVKRCGP